MLPLLENAIICPLDSAWSLMESRSSFEVSTIAAATHSNTSRTRAGVPPMPVSQSLQFLAARWVISLPNFIGYLSIKSGFWN